MVVIIAVVVVVMVMVVVFVVVVAGPDGSFVSTGACNLGVPGSNPGRNGYLSLWLCIYSAPNCSNEWSIQC